MSAEVRGEGGHGEVGGETGEGTGGRAEGQVETIADHWEERGFENHNLLQSLCTLYLSIREGGWEQRMPSQE